MPYYTTVEEKAFSENILEKGECVGNQHFLFPQCFPPYQRQKSSVKPNSFYRLQMLSIWTCLKSWYLVKVKMLLYILNRIVWICHKIFWIFLRISLTFSQTSPGLYVSLMQVLWKNTVGKGEIASNKQFLLFPWCFITVWQIFCHFNQIWNCRLQTLSVWKSLKFVVWDRINNQDSRSAHSQDA